MIAVLDVSAAIEILIKKEREPIFSEFYSKADWIIAPDLYVSELTNVLWKLHKAKLVEFDDCLQIAGDGINLIDDFFDSRDLWKEALGEGIKNGHSIYDMYYAILARRNEATLITKDGQLASICKKLKIEYLN